MESFKDKATTEKRKNLTKEEEKVLSKEQKIKAINEISTNIFNTLGNYKPRLLTSDDLINLYATYANANETNLKYTQEILSDSFLNSNKLSSIEREQGLDNLITLALETCLKI